MQTKSVMAGACSINNEELLSRFVEEDNCQKQILPENLGIGHSNIFKLDDDLNYIETHFAPSQNLAVLTRMNQQGPRMVMTLGLTGQSQFISRKGEEIVFKEGYTSITTFDSIEGARQYLGNKSVRQLRISMSKNWLENHFGTQHFAGFFNNHVMQLISHRPISTPANIVTQQLLNCNLSAKVRPLFRQGQIMALLASELNHLLADAQSPSKFTQKDKEIVYLARDILVAEFKNPPSVEELARRAGTNQFKLKQLFHHFLDNTPYGVLLDIRMQKAYQLLTTRQCPVAIAAEFVGYNYTSNFSTAFMKYFGLSPKQVNKIL